MKMRTPHIGPTKQHLPLPLFDSIPSLSLTPHSPFNFCLLSLSLSISCSSNPLPPTVPHFPYSTPNPSPSLSPKGEATHIMSHPNPNPNPNPSRTSHRRNSFPAPDHSKSMDSSSIRPKPFLSTSYNPSTHLSKLGIGRRASRARSPPPSHPHVVVLESDLQASKKSLSKSAIFGKSKPLSQPCPQPDHSTVRVVREAKRVGLEKQLDDSPPVVLKEKAFVKKEAAATAAGGGDLAVKPMVRLGRSRSLCDPKVELGNFLVINGVKLVNADMPPFMQIHAVGCARKTCDSLEKFSSKSVALSLKKEFDGAYGPAWHCIVGTSFGSFVTHSVGGFLYFSMDQKLHILLFKTTVERAK